MWWMIIDHYINIKKLKPSLMAANEASSENKLFERRAYFCCHSYHSLISASERAHSCWSSYVNYRNVKLQTTYKTQNGKKLSKIKTKHITNKKLAIFTYLFIHSFIHSLIYSIQLLKSWPSEWKLLTTSYHSSSSTKKIQRVLP